MFWRPIAFSAHGLDLPAPNYRFLLYVANTRTSPLHTAEIRTTVMAAIVSGVRWLPNGPPLPKCAHRFNGNPRRIHAFRTLCTAVAPKYTDTCRANDICRNPLFDRFRASPTHKEFVRDEDLSLESSPISSEGTVTFLEPNILKNYTGLPMSGSKFKLTPTFYFESFAPFLRTLV